MEQLPKFMELPRAEPQWDRHPPSHFPQAAKSALKETSPSYALCSSPTPSPILLLRQLHLDLSPRPGSIWTCLPHSFVLCLKESPKFTHNHVHANKHVYSLNTICIHVNRHAFIYICTSSHSPCMCVYADAHAHTSPSQRNDCSNAIKVFQKPSKEWNWQAM